MPSIDEINKHIYNNNCTLEQVSIRHLIDKNDYFRKLTTIKLNLVNKYSKNGILLDICCGTGDYLFENIDFFSQGYGIDYCDKFIQEAIRKKNILNISKINFLVGDARHIPLQDNYFDLVYSFSALYYISDIGHVLSEISRLLKPGAFAVLDFGFYYSLNTIVCNAYPELPVPCHVKLKNILALLKVNGLTVVEKRNFQLLPLWGKRPWWLSPLLLSFWRRIFQLEIRAKMLDEHLCSLPLLNKLCFRHILVVRKEIAKETE
jgi:ubiquinone/menaquinone biosynthesis C-methylase UbiE